VDKILLVEDEQELAQVTKDYFANHGYLVEIIGDGQQALDYLMLNSVKLLILVHLKVNLQEVYMSDID
jgi:DNA-binding response OmpR family regulator